MFTRNQTVAQVVQKHPETIQAWTALKTDCFGCYLMQFCSLKYVAKSYNLDLELLLEELQKTAATLNATG